MHGSFSRLSRIAILLLAGSIVVSCKAKPKVVIQPPPVTAARIVPEERIQQLILEGDREFSKQHLHGWRLAETAYAKAYDLDKRDSVKERLTITRLLIATREEDEDIPSRGLEGVLADLCAEPLDTRRKAICEIGTAYRMGFGMVFWQTRADRGTAPTLSSFAVMESPQEAYLYALHGKIFGLRADWGQDLNPYEKYKDSPLFIYLALGPETLRRTADLEKSMPDFAELIEFIGEAHFQNSRYKNARAYYNKALSLVPDYTRATNGLGNIFLFVLEDYENSLKTYQSTLELDSMNTVALFGKGASLHHLDRLEESNAALETMLSTDLTRKGRTSQFNVRYFRGQGLYYLAYNHHLAREPQQALSGPHKQDARGSSGSDSKALWVG